MSLPSGAPNPEHDAPQPGDSGQGHGQKESDVAKTGEVIPADQGSLASGGSPLVNALVISGARSGGEHDISSAAASHFHQELLNEKVETRRLRAQLASLQEKYTKCFADKRGLEAKIEGLEKPWHAHMRNIVGGGLMGASFKIYEFSGGMAAFFFVLGLALAAIQIVAMFRKS